MPTSATHPDLQSWHPLPSKSEAPAINCSQADLSDGLNTRGNQQGNGLVIAGISVAIIHLNSNTHRASVRLASLNPLYRSSYHLTQQQAAQSWSPYSDATYLPLPSRNDKARTRRARNEKDQGHGDSGHL